MSNGEYTILKKVASAKPKMIFDVGANIGHYAKLINDVLPEATIHCFEPVSTTFESLVKNLDGLGNENIHKVKKGFYKENKVLPINIYSGHELSSIFEIKGVAYSALRQESIDVIAGDTYISDNKIDHIDFLKMDLEGSEMDALIGLQNSLSQRKIRIVQFEYGYINITTKNLLADYYDFFKTFDFIIGKVYPQRVEFRDYEFKHEDFIGPNFIAVHKSDEVMIKLLSC
jgi:FkbM family methyltransferase